MGDKCYAPVYEDLRLSLAFEGRSKEQFTNVLSEYNSAHKVWGWKRPSILSKAKLIESKLRNPHYIFVFRDLFSVANRNSISMKADVKDALIEAHNSYTMLLEFLKGTDCPVMLVSSDKVTRFKEEFIEQLIIFSGINPSDQQRRKAVQFISPDPQDYLDKTRITKSRGGVNIDLLKTGLLRGWARGVHHLNPVTIEVEVNGKIIAYTKANIYREHLRKPNIHPTGRCGYELDLKPFGVTPCDILNVRVQDDINPLNPKPIQFNNLECWISMKD